jgi:hypothetical protein
MDATYRFSVSNTSVTTSPRFLINVSANYDTINPYGLPGNNLKHFSKLWVLIARHPFFFSSSGVRRNRTGFEK